MDADPAKRGLFPSLLSNTLSLPEKALSCRLTKHSTGVFLDVCQCDIYLSQDALPGPVLSLSFHSLHFPVSILLLLLPEFSRMFPWNELFCSPVFLGAPTEGCPARVAHAPLLVGWFQHRGGPRVVPFCSPRVASGGQTDEQSLHTLGPIGCFNLQKGRAGPAVWSQVPASSAPLTGLEAPLEDWSWGGQMHLDSIVEQCPALVRRRSGRPIGFPQHLSKPWPTHHLWSFTKICLYGWPLNKPPSVSLTSIPQACFPTCQQPKPGSWDHMWE